jgi:hypothetical protein
MSLKSNVANYIPSSYIIYDGDTFLTSDGDAINACSGSITINDVLEDIINYLSDIEGNCAVKVSSTDTTCGFLFDKLTSTNNSIAISKVTTTIGGIPQEIINLEVNFPPSQNSIILYSYYTDQARTTTGTYSNFTYTIPANTLDDGDLLEVEAGIEITTSTAQQGYSSSIKIDNQTSITRTGGNTSNIIKLSSKFIKISNTSMYSIGLGETVGINSSSDANLTTLPVSNLSLNSVNIDLTCLISNNPTLTAKYIIIKLTKSI